MPELIKQMTGYKATDANMMCKGVTFEVGVWQECEGELVECKNGFHFCEYPSGPWAYYSGVGTRIWKIEAEEVLTKKREPGADIKRVARRIRLVEEVLIGGDGNTGDRNAGDRNAGNWNTGNGNTENWNTGNWNAGGRNTGNWNAGGRNTGNWNTGDRNTGDRNAGDWNTGDRNAGDGNTGNRNTGNGNTGDWNTGDWNTGDGNAGDRNTGNGNTGDGNATNRASGFFCIEPQTVKSFDVETGLTYEQFTARYPRYWDLCNALMGSDPIDFDTYKGIPGITPEKLIALHNKHKEAQS